jgi:hypothetical protein
VATKITEMAIPKVLWTINLDQGLKFLTSSTRPTIPIIIAGINTLEARRKVLLEKFDVNDAT